MTENTRTLRDLLSQTILMFQQKIMVSVKLRITKILTKQKKEIEIFKYNKHLFKTEIRNNINNY